MLKIILASASPRRSELLGQIGLAFEVKTSNTDEETDIAEPGRLVEELSCRKAQAVLDTLENGMEDVLVIGADTVVASGGRILGKPSCKENALQMLKDLSGKTHEVYTGVTLLYRGRREPKAICDDEKRKAEIGQPMAENPEGMLRVRKKTFYETTRVTFYPLTEREMLHYISTGDCMDKAGAYGIQGIFARYVRKMDGDYNNVVGLPVGRLYQEAKEWLDDEEGSDI